MSKRKSISQSVRWNVFTRDGFACRYCGVSAGENDTQLVIDHILSVKDGGENSMDNLITACRSCNSGKSAKSLDNTPTPESVVIRINERTSNLREQSDAMRCAMEATQELEQEFVNLKCAAYGVESVYISNQEKKRIVQLCNDRGADKVLEWFSIAYKRDVGASNALQYVHGIIRNIRENPNGT